MDLFSKNSAGRLAAEQFIKQGFKKRIVLIHHYLLNNTCLALMKKSVH